MNKYYQPSIEEFHIGFEYEVKLNSGEWVQYKLDKLSELNFEDWSIRQNDVRVKCLDEQDILDLGWKKEETKSFPNYIIEKKEDGFNCYSKYTLVWTGRVNITSEYFSSWGGDKQNFSLKIKNKSELYKLMLQLGILRKEVYKEDVKFVYMIDPYTNNEDINSEVRIIKTTNEQIGNHNESNT